MSLSDLSLQALCRACLRPAAELSPLYGTERLALLFSSCSGLQIAQDDGLPSHICKSCTKQAMKASNFKHLCVVSDIKLRSYITGTAYDPSSIPEIKEELDSTNRRNAINLSTDDNIEISIVDGNSCVNYLFYDCTLCSHSSPTTKELIDHVLNTHTSSVKDENQYSCEICNTLFQSEFDLKKHQVLHKEFTVDGKNNTCPICRQEFGKHSLLVKHIEYHLEESLHECPECNCYFTKSIHLNNHIKSHKNCNYSTDDFVGAEIKVEPETYSQDSIKSEAKYPNSFNNILELSDNDELVVDIDEYSKNSDLKTEFVEPEITTYNDNSDLEDDYIEYTPKKRRAVKKKKKPKVVKVRHDKEPNAKLNIKILTGNIVQAKKSNNKSRNQKKSERTYLCSICGKGYHKQTSLDKHIQAHKNEDLQKPTHTCTICGKILNHKNHLLVHMRTHKDRNDQQIVKTDSPDKKVILCSMCGKSCSSRSNLAVHMRRHLGVMTCICKICGKGYPRTTDLTLHMRQHTGERPFVCTLCNKSFARSDKLTIHMRIHTGEKPYKCKICSRGFAQSNDLSAHKKRNNCSQNPVLPQMHADSNLTDADVKPNDLPINATKPNKIIETNKIRRNPNVQRASPADLGNSDSVDDDHMIVSAHTKAFELAAAAVTNNFFFMSGNNTNNRVLDFFNGESLAARNLVKHQNLMMPDLVATQRALEFATANHSNMLAAHQRSELSDYAAGTLLQNLSNAQSAQYDMR